MGKHDVVYSQLLVVTFISKLMQMAIPITVIGNNSGILGNLTWNDADFLSDCA